MPAARQIGCRLDSVRHNNKKTSTKINLSVDLLLIVGPTDRPTGRNRNFLQGAKPQLRKVGPYQFV